MKPPALPQGVFSCADNWWTDTIAIMICRWDSVWNNPVLKPIFTSHGHDLPWEVSNPHSEVKMALRAYMTIISILVMAKDTGDLRYYIWWGFLMGINTSFKVHMTCSHLRSPFRRIQVPPRGEKGYYLIPSSGLQFPCFEYLLSLDLVLIMDTPNPE